MHQTLSAGAPFPAFNLPTLGGGSTAIGGQRDKWQLVVVYRGKHCPLCKKFLTKLNEITDQFDELGGEIITLSADPEEKAQALKDEIGVDLPIAYDLSVEQMKTLGLYISEPRSDAETDRPFAEPGTFLLTPSGDIQIIDISNAPFARPEPEAMLLGLKMGATNEYPVRGTMTA